MSTQQNLSQVFKKNKKIMIKLQKDYMKIENLSKYCVLMGTNTINKFTLEFNFPIQKRKRIWLFSSTSRFLEVFGFG